MKSQRCARVLLLTTVIAALAGAYVVSGSAVVRAQTVMDPFEDASALLAPFTRQGLADLPRISEGIGGAAWLDADGDGYLDLFIANGAAHPNALFRNNGDGTFTNIATAAGVDDRDGHAGVAAADIDNDGCPDLFLAGEGSGVGIIDFVAGETPARLYVNSRARTSLGRARCSAVFTDITVSAGLPVIAHGAGAAWGDINNDGYVDLFVIRPNVSDIPQSHKNGLYLNNGDRTFTDITDRAGPGLAINMSGCAVGFSDYNRDGWVDIFVGHCSDVDMPALPMVIPIATPFQLLRNNGNLTFTDVAPQVGLGEPGFWMSVTLGDVNADGHIDLFSTNMGPMHPPGFPHALFMMDRNGMFTNRAVEAGVAHWEFGFGASMADVDNDGDRDIFYTGSLAIPPFGMIGPGIASPGRLFINDGTGKFTMAASYGQERKYTTGTAAADYDNDGFQDIVVISTSVPGQPGRPLLLHNRGNDNNWLTVRLVGTKSNRGAIGARVEVRAEGIRMVDEVRAGSSFISTETPWPGFGLRTARRADVTVWWPSGRTETYKSIRANQIVTLVEGKGRSHSR